MKKNEDISKGWITKAENDIINLKTMLEKELALDTACFHAQQAAEKYLKALLYYNNIQFPLTHDIEELLKLCIEIDNRFRNLIKVSVFLTEYAVESRYDFDFLPEKSEVEDALEAVYKIKQLVLSLLPETLYP